MPATVKRDGVSARLWNEHHRPGRQTTCAAISAAMNAPIVPERRGVFQM